MRALKLGLPFLFIAMIAVAALGQKKGRPAKPAPTSHTVSVVKAKCESNGLTQPEIADLLASHNRARAEQRLQPLAWDCMLANMAQRWADRGVFEHRGDTSYGENLFVSSNPAEPVGTVVQVWLGERTNWNNKTGQCSPGKTCTHYTQVMWKSTTRVGCGINRSSPGKWQTLVVCNYSPPGNYGGPPF